MILDKPTVQRYQRQITLAEVGTAGQEALLRSSVLVVGAGGLGCPALQYLCGAGIGKIGIVDFDRVELGNLHRQLLFGIADIGKLKAEVAAEKLKQLNPELEIYSYSIALDNASALQLFSEYNYILDATDQIHIRYLINDACNLLSRPWIYGSVSTFEGQWAMFSMEKNTANFRDIFPVPANPMTAVNCAVNGTLGMVPGVVGTMQAMELVKHVCGIYESEKVHLYSMNFKDNSTYAIVVEKGMETAWSHMDADAFLQTDYQQYVMDCHYQKGIQ